MLDSKSYKLLKFIKKNANISLDEIISKFGDGSKDFVNFLQKNDYIINDIKGYLPCTNGLATFRTNKYRISPEGLAYIQELRRERRKYWIPIIAADSLSAVAIGISIYSLFLQYQ